MVDTVNFKITFFISILILISLATTQVFAAEIRYVSSIHAKLLKQPNFKSELLKQLPKGSRLTVSRKKGTWLNVKTDNQYSGWISKFLTKTTPPTERATILTGEKHNLLKNIHRRTSAITTAAAARGLASKANANTSHVPTDLKAVIYMESFTITETQLNAFARLLDGGK